MTRHQLRAKADKRSGLKEFLLRVPSDLWRNFEMATDAKGTTPTAMVTVLIHAWLAKNQSFAAFYLPGLATCPDCGCEIKIYGRRKVRCTRRGCGWEGMAKK